MIKFKNRIWAGALFAQIFLFYFVSKSEKIIFWHDIFFESQKETHQKIFSWLPFSVGDIFYFGLIFWVGYFLIQIFKRGKSRLIYFGVGLNVLYFYYQIFWGLLYFQEPLKSQFVFRNFEKVEIENLTLKYLERCKVSRNQLAEDENGVFKIQNLEEIKIEILRNQRKLPQNFAKRFTDTQSIKPSLFSGLMSFTGIAGYYNPFSAEAQYNARLPHSMLPFTIAHENAHQQGFAREQEASFIGYLLGKDSENKALKYSTEWYVLKSLLRFQSVENPDFVSGIFEDFSPEMQRDYLFERQFYEEYNGWFTQFFVMTNDLFLKFNQQEGRITYDYFVDLLLLYESSEKQKEPHKKCDSKNTNDEKIITPS